MKPSPKFSLTIAFVIILGLLGSWMIFYATDWGPWAFSDSAEYVASARNLLEGNGLGYFAPSGNFKPLTLHPPLYPLVLSAVGLTGMDIISVARWVNIFLFGVTIILSGILTYSLFHSSWTALLLSVSLLSLPSFVDVSTGAMSELLFVFTSILGVYLLFFYFTQRRRYLLILSAAFMGMAFLTRFPGVIVILTTLIVILVLGRESWKKKILDSLILSLVGLAPSIAWLLLTYIQTNTLAARSFFIPPNLWAATFPLRTSLMEVIWRWLPFRQFVPVYTYQQIRNITIVLSAVFIILVGVVVYRRLKLSNSTHNSTLMLDFALFWMIFIIGSLTFMAASYIFSDLQISLNERTYLPIQFGLAFVIFTLIAYVITESRHPHAAGWVCTALVLIFIIPNIQSTIKLTNQYHQYGHGYTSSAWHSSLTLQALDGLPADIPIITNETAAVLLLINRPAYDFCSFPCNQSGQLKYGDDLQDPIQRAFRNNGAALALFYPFCGDPQDPLYTQMVEHVIPLTQNLELYFSSCDGAIYFYPSP